MPLCVPIRPSETSPDQLRRWRERRERVGARIRELRVGQNLSQEALALESGLSRVMIIKVESGEKSVACERLWDLADVLRVDVVDMLSAPSTDPTVRPRKKGRVSRGPASDSTEI